MLRADARRAGLSGHCERVRWSGGAEQGGSGDPRGEIRIANRREQSKTEIERRGHEGQTSEDGRRRDLLEEGNISSFSCVDELRLQEQSELLWKYKDALRDDIPQDVLKNLLASNHQKAVVGEANVIPLRVLP